MLKRSCLVTEEMSEAVAVEIIKTALPKIFDMIEENNFPFIAKIHKDSAVSLWKKELMTHKGIQLKKRI